jgi:hypothetical protein
LRADLIVILWKYKHAIDVEVVEGVVQSLKDALYILIAVILTRPPIYDISALVYVL